MRKIEIALPKGSRLLKESYQIFKKIGLASQSLENEMERGDRKQLEFDTDDGKYQFLLIKNSEIPQYVDRNWADLGVSQFDNFREYELSNITARGTMRGDNFCTTVLPDFKLCPQARFCVAGKKEQKDFYEKCKTDAQKVLAVATSYPNIAAHYFLSKQMLVDIVTVQGSVELMPKHADVDVIFDIVESGRALKENGLVVFEEAMQVQTKVLVSKAALKYDPNIQELINKLKGAIK